MRLMGLDFGGAFGWSIFDGEAYVQSGVVYQSGDSKFTGAYSQLLEIARLHRPDLLVYENVRRHMSIGAAHAFGGYLAVSTLVAMDVQAKIKGIEVKQIKRLVAGSGAAGKPRMVEAVNELLGLSVENWDEADAIAVVLAHHKLAS